MHLTRWWKNSYWIVAGLLITMAVLMFGPAQRDSATVDETTFLSAGYSYWTGYRFYMVPEHPPAAQMLSSLPLTLMDIRASSDSLGLLSGRLSYPWTRPWFGPIRSLQDVVPKGCAVQY